MKEIRLRDSDLPKDGRTFNLAIGLSYDTWYRDNPGKHAVLYYCVSTCEYVIKEAEKEPG